jgi:hypothetical protein
MGGRHWNTTENKVVMCMTKDEKGQLSSDLWHIRAVDQKQYMRHYSGDADNFKQNYTDRDTAWTLINNSDGSVRFQNYTATQRYLAAAGGNDNHKLHVPETNADTTHWVLEEASKPDPTLPAGFRPVTIVNDATGRYAARNPTAHWHGVTQRTILFIGPDSQGRTFNDTATQHVRDFDGAFMRHYRGDGDNFCQSYTDSDTAWEIKHNDGKATFVNVSGSTTRYLSDNGSKLCCSTDQNTATRWTVTDVDPAEALALLMNPSAAEDEKEEGPPLTPNRWVHIQGPSNPGYFRHYNGDADNFSQSYTDGDTLWGLIPVPNGQPNEVYIKHANRDRWLTIDTTSGNKLHVPESASAEQKIWILTPQSEAEAKVEEPVVEPTFFSLYSEDRGQFLMHHSGNDTITDQNYTDRDTVFKCVARAGGMSLQSKAGRYLTRESGQLKMQAGAFNSSSMLWQVELANVEGKAGEEDDAPATFMENKISKLHKLACKKLTGKKLINARATLLAASTFQKILGCGVTEVTGVHVRMAAGPGVSVNMRGLVIPDAIADLFQRVMP